MEKSPTASGSLNSGEIFTLGAQRDIGREMTHCCTKLQALQSRLQGNQENSRFEQVDILRGAA